MKFHQNSQTYIKDKFLYCVKHTNTQTHAQHQPITSMKFAHAYPWANTTHMKLPSYQT